MKLPGDFLRTLSNATRGPLRSALNALVIVAVFAAGAGFIVAISFFGGLISGTETSIAFWKQTRAARKACVAQPPPAVTPIRFAPRGAGIPKIPDSPDTRHAQPFEPGDPHAS